MSVLFASLVFAGTVTQTDWSGNGGVQGPVNDWSDVFWSSHAGIDFSEGQLGLSSYLISPIEHTIDETYLSGAYHISTTDIDGDGDEDLLVSGHIAGAQFGSITLWKNADGIGTTWIELKIIEIMTPPTAYSADIDGDGNADVLGTGRRPTLAWWDVIESSLEGDLESSILYTDNVREWNTFFATVEEPPGTSVSFQFRCLQHGSMV